MAAKPKFEQLDQDTILLDAAFRMLSAHGTALDAEASCQHTAVLSAIRHEIRVKALSSLEILVARVSAVAQHAAASVASKVVDLFFFHSISILYQYGCFGSGLVWGGHQTSPAGKAAVLWAAAVAARAEKLQRPVKDNHVRTARDLLRKIKVLECRV